MNHMGTAMAQEKPMTPARTRLTTAEPAAVSNTAPAVASPVQLSSDEVLRGQKSVAITHNGALYRLQTTRQGKLILTK